MNASKTQAGCESAVLPTNAVSVGPVRIDGPRPASFDEHAVGDVVILLVCAGVAVLSLLLDARDDGVYLFGLGWPTRCALYETIGVKCAFCGMTRSFCAMAHGDVPTSYAFHRLGPALFGFVLLQLAYRVYALAIRPRRVSRTVGSIGWVAAIVLVIAVFGDWATYLGGFVL